MLIYTSVPHSGVQVCNHAAPKLASNDNRRKPYVRNYSNSASVKATVLGEGKGKKVVVYKYKRKTGYHKKQGHRQPFTQVKIEAINA